MVYLTHNCVIAESKKQTLKLLSSADIPITSNQAKSHRCTQNRQSKLSKL